MRGVERGEELKYIQIVNWQKYQHYRDRNPPWIKLHVKLLTDRKFMLLADASKCLLMLLWVLASETDGEIPLDLEEIEADMSGQMQRIRDWEREGRIKPVHGVQFR